MDTNTSNGPHRPVWTGAERTAAAPALEATGTHAIDVLGTSCAVGDVRTAARVGVARVGTRAGGYAVFCNVHLLMTAMHEATVRSALDGAWLVFPDGAPIAWFQRRRGEEAARRIGGPDFMLEMMDVGRAGEVRHALFGSTEDVVSRLQRRLLERYPGLVIVDAYAPARGEENTAECLERLRGAEADVIWCALGAPKQERWMQQVAPSLEPALLFGVGAAFDFHSGVKRRAPLWMQRVGIEWLHRLLSEPRRLSRRYLVTNSQFVFHAARAVVRERLGRPGRA